MPADKSLSERIAALKRSSSPNPSNHKAGNLPIPKGGHGLREKIARFDAAGGAPIPQRGASFGLGAPVSGDRKVSGGLVGNRIPSAGRYYVPRSRSSSPSVGDVDSPTGTPRSTESHSSEYGGPFDDFASPPLSSSGFSDSGELPSRTSSPGPDYTSQSPVESETSVELSAMPQSLHLFKASGSLSVSASSSLLPPNVISAQVDEPPDLLKNDTAELFGTILDLDLLSISDKPLDGTHQATSSPVISEDELVVVTPLLLSGPQDDLSVLNEANIVDTQAEEHSDGSEMVSLEDMSLDVPLLALNAQDRIDPIVVTTQSPLASDEHRTVTPKDLDEDRPSNIPVVMLSPPTDEVISLGNHEDDASASSASSIIVASSDSFTRMYPPLNSPLSMQFNPTPPRNNTSAISSLPYTLSQPPLMISPVKSEGDPEPRPSDSGVSSNINDVVHVIRLNPEEERLNRSVPPCSPHADETVMLRSVEPLGDTAGSRSQNISNDNDPSSSVDTTSLSINSSLYAVVPASAQSSELMDTPPAGIGMRGLIDPSKARDESQYHVPESSYLVDSAPEESRPISPPLDVNSKGDAQWAMPFPERVADGVTTDNPSTRHTSSQTQSAMVGIIEGNQNMLLSKETSLPSPSRCDSTREIPFITSNTAELEKQRRPLPPLPPSRRVTGGTGRSADQQSPPYRSFSADATPLTSKSGHVFRSPSAPTRRVTTRPPAPISRRTQLTPSLFDDDDDENYVGGWANVIVTTRYSS